MKKALSQISKSPFTQGIEKVKLPRRFHQPMFPMYNGRIDPVEHVSQFKQKMAVHSQDKALLCRVFPSSLGPMPVTRNAQKLHPVNPILMKRSTHTRGGEKFRLEGG